MLTAGTVASSVKTLLQLGKIARAKKNPSSPIGIEPRNRRVRQTLRLCATMFLVKFSKIYIIILKYKESIIKLV